MAPAMGQSDAMPKLAEWLERLRGRAVPPSAQRSGLPTLARIAESQLAIPEPIRKALRELPEGDGASRLAGREKLVAGLDEATAGWLAGKPSNVAVIGPRGSGMSALLVALRERTFARPPQRGDLDEEVVVSEVLSYQGRVRSEAGIVEFLADRLGIDLARPDVEHLVAKLADGPRRVVFLEDAQDMLLRVVDGTHAMEALLAITGRTAIRVLWVVSCRRQTWRILDHQFGVRRGFPHCLSAELPDPAPIAAAIRAWNAAAPAPVSYRAAKPTRRSERKPGQDLLEEEFLEILWKVAGGNLIAARLYWLDSLAWDVERERFRLAALYLPDMSVTRSLPRAQLYCLLSILQHGGLSADEHAEIYLTDPTFSRRTLEALVQTGLVDPLGDGTREARYDINPAADTRLVSTLEDLNLIY